MNLRSFSVLLRLTMALVLSGTISAAFAIPARAGADDRPTINIDFGTASSQLYTGVGADPNDSGVIWNKVAPNGTATSVKSAPLLDSNGNVTASVFSMSNVTAASTSGGANPTTNPLLVDYLVGTTTTITFAVTNLQPMTRYKLYVYGAGSASGQGSTFIYGGDRATTSGTARGSSFVHGVNYAVIDGFPFEDGTLNLSIISNSTGTGAFPVINGIQIQQDVDALITPPSRTDAFDISQGTTILGGSPTLQGRPYEPAFGGVIPNNTRSDPQSVLFRAGDPVGTVDFIEFKLPSVKTIRSISIYSSAPTNPKSAATQITLWGYNAATGAYDIKAFEVYPANPYALTLAPTGAAVQSTSDPALLAVTANITPVTTDRFRIEMVQAESGAAAGIRLNEVDGFTTLSPGLLLPVPIITTATSTSGQVGQAFSYQLAGSNNPTSFVADGLPSGLKFNAPTGSITGAPTLAGTFDVAVRAANASGNGPTATLRITVSPADENIQGLKVLSPPSDITVIQNKSVDLYAEVAATSGSLKSVQFLLTGPNGTTNLAASNVSRTQTTWQPSTPGDYSLKVLATDINSQTRQITQPIHVLAAGAVDSRVSVLSGVNNQQFALGSSIPIIASAATSDGTAPSDVRFFLDGQEVPVTLISAASLDGTGAAAAFRTAGRYPRLSADGSGAGDLFAVGSIPITKLEQLLTAVVTGSNGVSSVSSAVKLMAKPARTNAVSVEVDDANGTPLASGNIVPAKVSVRVTNSANRIAKVAFFADAQPVGAEVTAEPFEFTMTGLSSGQHVLTALATDDADVSSVSDPIVVNVPAVPLVSVQVTTALADAATGQQGVITVNRTGGDLTKKLKVQYTAVGAAVAGRNYQTLSGTVKIKANKGSAQILITPLAAEGETGTKKIKFKLTPSAKYTVAVPSGGKIKVRQ